MKLKEENILKIFDGVVWKKNLTGWESATPGECAEEIERLKGIIDRLEPHALGAWVGPHPSIEKMKK